MKFRLRAFALHLAASCVILTLVLGGFYLGWYHWPGWYLADVGKVTLVLACADLVLGPLLTLVIASPHKPRRALARDVAVIAAVQLSALVYGSLSLWDGRPLYYALSEDVLQVVQAYDIDPAQLTLAHRQKLPLAPHWYSLPRWIWAPLPQDAHESAKIVEAAIAGGADVIAMPRYYQPWEAGRSALRAQLKRVEDIRYFSVKERALLAERMRAAKISPSIANAMPFTGRAHPLLAVFDDRLALIAILPAH